MAEETPRPDLSEMTVAQLRARASELQITGRSAMTKEELRQAVTDAEEQTAQLEAAVAAPSAPAREAEPTPVPDAEPEVEAEPEHETEPVSSVSAAPPPAAAVAGEDVEHRPSDVDAMGLDKRRQVMGKKYGASFAQQATVYGLFLAVVVALAIGGKLLADELDAPPETNPDAAPWSDPAAEQRPPAPIDFPVNPSP